MTARSQGATQIVLARTDGPFCSKAGRSASRCGRCRRARARRRDRCRRCWNGCSRTNTCCWCCAASTPRSRPTSSCRSTWDWLKGKTPATQDDPHYAGTLNFFNVVRPPGAEGVHGPGSVRQLRRHRRDSEPAHVEEADRSRPTHAAAGRQGRRGVETLDLAHRSGAAVDGTPGTVYCRRQTLHPEARELGPQLHLATLRRARSPPPPASRPPRGARSA